MPPSPLPDLERRRLVLTLGLLWGGAALGLAVPVLRLLAAPLDSELMGEGDELSVELDLAEHPLTDQWREVKLVVQERRAWRASVPKVQPAFVRELAGQIEVVSGVCTHLGCHVLLEPDGTFHCPCHDGKFDAHARYASGPPPRDLDRLEARRTEQTLRIRLPRPEETA